MKKACIVLFLLSSSCLFSFGQSIAEMDKLKTHRNISRPQKSFVAASKHNRNELEFIMSGLFLFYKKFVSSQDGNSCTFSPSCSEYALMAIKRMGLIEGSAATFDRISRCNGLSPEKYQRSMVNPSLMLDSLKITRR